MPSRRTPAGAAERPVCPQALQVGLVGANRLDCRLARGRTGVLDRLEQGLLRVGQVQALSQTRQMPLLTPGIRSFAQSRSTQPRCAPSPSGAAKAVDEKDSAPHQSASATIFEMFISYSIGWTGWRRLAREPPGLRESGCDRTVALCRRNNSGVSLNAAICVSILSGASGPGGPRRRPRDPISRWIRFPRRRPAGRAHLSPRLVKFEATRVPFQPAECRHAAALAFQVDRGLFDASERPQARRVSRLLRPPGQAPAIRRTRTAPVRGAREPAQGPGDLLRRRRVRALSRRSSASR